MKARVIAALLLPMVMFGTAVSFFTVLIYQGGSQDGIVWPYAVVFTILTAFNLGLSVWNAHARK